MSDRCPTCGSLIEIDSDCQVCVRASCVGADTQAEYEDWLAWLAEDAQGERPDDEPDV